VSEAHRGKRPAGLGSFVIATMEMVWRLHAPHASPQTGGLLAQPVAAFE